MLSVQWPEYFKFTNFGNDFIKRNLIHLNPFWKDVFQALHHLFTSFKNVQSLTFHDFLNEPIWYNDGILINRKPIFYRRLYSAGVHIVNDLLDEDGKFLSFDEFSRRIPGTLNFIEYNGLLISIRQFKLHRYPNVPALERRLSAPTIPYVLTVIMKSKRGCRDIYEKIIQNNVMPTSHRKWENQFGPIQSYKWKQIYQLPFKCTMSTNTRWFQYRLVHRILATNTFLQKIGIVNCNICSFCKTDPETLSHLFYSCRIVSNFWRRISQWIIDKCHHIDSLSLTEDEIILGEVNKRKADLTLNFIILSAKQYIYKCRTSQQTPQTQNFKMWLKETYNTEKYIAFKNCKWDDFNKKWTKYKNLFQEI